ncbi:ABC-three component system protein [Paracoccus sp. (in: a-proteobacteria)]|uniref:ABC-three component system protein n=1 Tax=Paracoccus sp. TaxID=267 RepID=UPI002B00372A|nr:ABC-three component system protein [Paracoccus sp. (in: a-proteobacteria)]
MSFLGTKTNLSQSNVGGDQAGGSIDKSTTIYNQIDGVKPSQITRLLRLLAHQILQDESMSGFVEDLQFFIDNRDGETIIGLENKLLAGGRSDTYTDAKRKKEFFAKLLLRYERFSSAQQLFAYIMAAIHETFESKIIPFAEVLSRKEIDDLVDAEIIEKIMIEFGEGSDHLTLNKTHLKGMIYWLADKCYVRWHCD